ncbi:cysteine dioxygenase [Verticiella sediminum]|uniref:Cysteine dioxygenase n=1 Tax=Verticiella sediminum TaxID=1247510 RepID=A0A556ARL4_9BURK|nr:cysteine dioxygenase [Verticiella sediminum]TSH95055.1 cysteine dioxygenase [Verticiella sediminum]
MTTPDDTLAPLRDYVAHMTRIADTLGTPAGLEQARALLAQLVARDDWLPEAFAQPHPQFYQQYLLHGDPLERFSVVSFVWGPGQRTPIHDHCTWGLIGMLRGAERGQRYTAAADGSVHPDGEAALLEPGDIELVSPATGDWHVVENAYADRVSISIHVYGGNIGAIARHVYDPAAGVIKPFVSGYSAPVSPNLWDRSAQVRATLAGGKA